MLYWLFTLQSVITFISFLSFLAAVMHFGISSWLFLFRNKSGRVLGITTGSLLMVWPIQVIVNSIADAEYSLLPYYLMPVLFSLLTTALHIIYLQKPAMMGKISRYLMAAVPAFLFLVYVCFVTMESIKEGALNIVF
jgi:hypothetical protein